MTTTAHTHIKNSAAAVVEQLETRRLLNGDFAPEIYSETFDEPEGSTSGRLDVFGSSGGPGWQTFRDNVGDGTFEVRDGALVAKETSGIVSWYTELSLNRTVDFSLDLAANGVGPNDYARVVLFPRFAPAEEIALVRGQDGRFTATASAITPGSVRLEVQLLATQGQFAIDNLSIQQIPGPEASQVELVDGVLRITGTQGADDIAVRSIQLTDGSLGTQVFINNFAGGDDIYDTTRVWVDLLGGSDEFQQNTGIGDGLDVTAFGGLGPDRMVGSAGVNEIHGGDGDDFIVHRFDADGLIFGGDGDDQIRVRDESETDVEDGAGNDRFEFNQRVAGGRTLNVNGGPGDDYLFNGPGTPEVFTGGPGQDTVGYNDSDGGEFFVSFDGLPNDGASGEGDNIGTDVEEVVGATIVNQPPTDGQQLFAEPFDEPDGATTGNLTPTGIWRTFQPNGGIAVRDGVLVIEDTTDFVSWFTSDLDIGGQGPVDVSIDLTGTGLGPDDLANFLYRVDGGALQQFAFTRATDGSLTATANGIVGNALKLEVQFKAVVGTYTLDNVTVTAADAPPTGAFLDGQTLRIVVTDGAETWTIVNPSEGPGGFRDNELQITGPTGEPDFFQLRDVDDIVIDLAGGDDRLFVEDVYGEFPLSEALGSDGADRFEFRTVSALRGVLDGQGGDDFISVSNFGDPATLHGGDGNDTLVTNGTGYIVEGGNGDDTLVTGVGGDDFTGGPGNDTVDYRPRTDGPFTVSFDDVANDGAEGEGDNIRDDVEVALGASVVGEPGSVTLYTEFFDEAPFATSGNLTPSGEWRTYGPAGGIRLADGRDTSILRVSGTEDNPSGFVSWYTTPLDIAGAENVAVEMFLSGRDLTDRDLVRFLYRIDDGPNQEFFFTRGTDGVFTPSIDGLSGGTLRLEVQFRAEGDATYFLDDIVITSAPSTGGPTAQVIDRTLVVTGTSGDDNLSVAATENFLGVYRVSSGTNVIAEFPVADVDGVRIDALDGDDVVTAGVGLNTDTLSGGTSAITVFGGAGDDRLSVNAALALFGDEGQPGVFGGEGNDTLNVSGVDAYGDAGDDELIGGTLFTGSFFGGDGNDTLRAGTFGANLFGGDGDDELVARGATADGGAGNDNIRMSFSPIEGPRVGVVRGGPGQDTIVAGGTDNRLIVFGGSDDDEIRISNASSFDEPTSVTVDGEGGNDLLDIQGPAFVLGGDGADTLVSGFGAQDFTGGSGTDTVDYRGRSGGPFAVSFDNVANDGAEGEGDNIRDDVEVALGATVVGEPSGDVVLAEETFDEPTGATTGSFVNEANGAMVTWRTSNGGPNASVADGVFRVRASDGFVSWFTPTIDLDNDQPYSVRVDINVSDDAEGFVWLRGAGELLRERNIGDLPGQRTLRLDGRTSDPKFEFSFNLTAGEVTFDNLRLFIPGAGDGVQVFRDSDGVVQIVGTDQADDIRIIEAPGDGFERVSVLVDSVEVGRFEGGTRFSVDLGGGDDRFVIDPDVPFTRATINAGGGDDVVELSAGEFVVDLGAGDDRIATSSGQSTIDGGDGNDTLLSGPGADVFAGGAGSDTVDYGDRTGARVTFDGLANDGVTGERDNIGSDVETVLNASTDGDEQVTIASESFNESDGSTAGSLNNINGDPVIPWQTFRGGVGDGFFAVDNGKLRASNTAGFVSWYTGGNISIAETDTLSAATRVEIDFTATGLGPDDLARFLYRVDGGASTQFAFIRSSDGSFTAVAEGLVGQTLRLEVQLQAKVGTITLTDVRVTKSSKDVAQGSLTETFDEPDGSTQGQISGTNNDNGLFIGGTWNTFRGGPNFSVQDGVFRATDTDGFRTWYTSPLTRTNDLTRLSIDLASFGTLTDVDRLNVLYRIDDGPAQMLATIRGGVDQAVTVDNLPPGRVRIEIQANVTTDAGGYTWDNISFTAVS
ncbi:MAG: hypothetical protein AAGD32_06465 [Planctomycetota bacterium]